MKIIVMTKHNRHTDDEVRVFEYSEENVAKVKKEMETHWADGEWGFFGDLPCVDGKQFGWEEGFYSSYSIGELEEI